MTFEGEGPFSGEFIDLRNVPELPEGISGGQILEQNADAIRQVAEARHAAGLSEINADGGFVDAFADSSKVASSSKVNILTLDGGGKGIVKLGIGGKFDINTASFSQSISSQDSVPTGLAFNNDGTKLFESGFESGKIYESTLSTPFDISTASFSQSISSQDTQPEDVEFNNDGTKLFEIGSGGNKLYESTLSTPFDISTASFSQSISTQTSGPTGLEFNNDGTKLFTIHGNARIFEFTLSTPFDISTAGSFDEKIFAQDSLVSDVEFNNDGTKMYETNGFGDKIFESTLSTPFDISTASFSQSISTQKGFNEGVEFNNDGTKMFIASNDGDIVREFDLGSGFVSSGTVIEQQFTFTDTQGNAFSPSKVGIFPEQTLNGQSISYDLKDSSGSVVKTFNQADLNQLQSVNTADDTFQVEANFSGDGSQTPELEFLDVRGV